MTEKAPYMSLGKVPRWVQENLRLTVTRKTVYNWALRGNDPKGQRNVPLNEKIKLRTTRKLGHYYTTRLWLEEFFMAIN